MKMSLRLCSVRRGRSGMGWPLLSNVEFKAKIDAKSFALSDEDEITSGPFKLVGTDVLPLLSIWLEKYCLYC